MNLSCWLDEAITANGWIGVGFQKSVQLKRIVTYANMVSILNKDYGRRIEAVCCFSTILGKVHSPSILSAVANTIQ